MCNLLKAKKYLLLVENCNAVWASEVAASIRLSNIIEKKECVKPFRLDVMDERAMAYFGRKQLSEDEFLEACTCLGGSPETRGWWEEFVLEGALCFVRQTLAED